MTFIVLHYFVYKSQTLNEGFSSRISHPFWWIEHVMVGRYGGGDLKQCPPSVLYLFLFISRQNICSVLLLILFIAFYPFHSFIFVESNVILITESKYKYNIYTYIFSNPLAYTNDRRNEFRILLYFALVFTVYIINIPECFD